MIEWRFARTQLFMEYIKEGSTLPVPLNLITRPTIICKLLSQIRRCCGRTKVGSRPLDEEKSEIKASVVVVFSDLFHISVTSKFVKKIEMDRATDTRSSIKGLICH